MYRIKSRASLFSVFMMLSISLFVSGYSNAASKVKTYKIKHDGLTRAYRVYTPKSNDGQAAVPVLFYLHAYIS